MKNKCLLLLCAVFLMVSCRSQQYGCPGSTYYNKGNAKQNARAGKQMRLF